MAVEIGVLSDTHWPTRVPAIQWEAIEAAFAGVSLILHAGDIETPDVLERLTQIAPVEAVSGDDDQFRLPLRRVVSVGGKHIGLTHGHRPFVIEKRDRVRKLLGFKTDPWNGMFGDLLRWFKDDAIEAIVFGHWHRTYSGVHDGVLLFNPDARHAALADDRATAFRAPSRAAGLAAPLRSHPAGVPSDPHGRSADHRRRRGTFHRNYRASPRDVGLSPAHGTYGSS